MHAGGQHHHNGCGRHIPVVSPSRRLFQNIMSGNPSGALSQLKTLSKTVMTDLKETEAHSADYLTPEPRNRFSKGDRRLLDNIMSGNPSGALTQFKTLSKTVMTDLKETEAHAADYLTPEPRSRFSKGDRRLMQNIMSGNPSGALSQLKTLSKTVMTDLKETEAHSADYLTPEPRSRFSKGDGR
jgi:hypothetical protein